MTTAIKQKEKKKEQEIWTLQQICRWVNHCRENVLNFICNITVGYRYHCCHDVIMQSVNRYSWVALSLGYKRPLKQNILCEKVKVNVRSSEKFGEMYPPVPSGLFLLMAIQKLPFREQDTFSRCLEGKKTH